MFQAGKNDLLVRFDTIALQKTPYAFVLQIQDLADVTVEILLPTEIEEGLLGRRLALEDVVDNVYLDRYVFAYMTGDRYDKNEPILLLFSNNLETTGEITHRLQSLHGDIYQAGLKKGEPGAEFELARLFPLWNGPHHLALLPEETDYYKNKIQFQRKDPFWIVRTPFSMKPYGTFANRAHEAVEDAAKRRNEHIFVEVVQIRLERLG